jgi:hypothetical protein
MKSDSLPGCAGALAARGSELPGLRSHLIAARNTLVSFLVLSIGAPSRSCLSSFPRLKH